MMLNHLGINAKAFSEKLGYERPQIIYDIIKGKTKKISVDLADKITSVFPEFSRSWLLADEGEMIKAPSESNAAFLGHASKIQPDDANLVEVRFFEITPTASFKEFCSNINEESTTIQIQSFDDNIDDSYCVFEIYGESMAPQIQSKAKVLCKEVPASKWHTLSSGVIVIAYADEFVIKRIINNSLNTGNFLVLGSDNPDFPEKHTVQLCDIRTIFLAKKIISQSIY